MESHSQDEAHEEQKQENTFKDLKKAHYLKQNETLKQEKKEI